VVSILVRPKALEQTNLVPIFDGSHDPLLEPAEREGAFGLAKVPGWRG